MSQLAIKGHATRGKEVIEILEMLGGRNPHNYSAVCGSLCFYIGKENNMIYYDWVNYPNSDVVILSLEEFLEKFPYKVGDKVQHKGATSCGSIFEVEEMRWEENTVKYTLCLFGCNYKRSTLPAEYLQPYKEDTMEENTDTALAPDLKGQDYSGRRFGYKIPNGYEFECVRKNEIILKPIKPQYPRDYDECCEVLSLGEDSRLYTKGYKANLIQDFQKLLICRDAYWKIAGNWKPDWNDNSKFKYVITCKSCNIIMYSYCTLNCILAFPTAEMRDAFYGNFKELIEECKELL